MEWKPGSWRGRPIRQQPRYRDEAAVRGALDALRALPPLVLPGEVDALRDRLADVARSRRFLLQGGDCAERFADCTPRLLEAKLGTLREMARAIGRQAGVPIVRVHRLAGQYAKPRSADTERVDGKIVEVYRGDLVNGLEPSERQPDPARIVHAYFHAAATLNYARALFTSTENPSEGFFASHEALLLEREEALTVRREDRWYNLGAHLLWLGDRTRHVDEAHAEYLRGIANPIGVKVGPGIEPAELVDLVRWLDPEGEPGRITLITRYGADRVRDVLPGHLDAVSRAGLPVAWACDPMHGNTVLAGDGRKTRSFERILDELGAAFEIHDRAGRPLAGVHFELTGEDVTECTGGPQELKESDLARSYQTSCDPRLNQVQSLEMASLIARRLAGHQPHGRMR